MNNIVLVHVLKSYDHVGHEKFALPLIEDPFVSQMIPQIPTIKVVHDQEQILSVLEGTANIDQERMTQS